MGAKPDESDSLPNIHYQTFRIQGGNLSGNLALMRLCYGTILRLTQERTRKNGFSAEEKAELGAPEVWPELDALLEKIEGLRQTNKQLRELVAQLSVLVIRNVVERKA